MDSLANAGVVTLGNEQARPWGEQSDKILDVLRRHAFGHTDYRYVTPAPTEDDRQQMRADLLAVSSVLEDFSGQVQKHLEGACAVFVPEVGLAGFDTNTRALLAYAVSICMGNPTATDRQRVIWDVKSRPTHSTYFSTFSETDQEAAYHTDAQYYPAPESFFLLYCMEAARCGGGMSSVCDARALRGEIDAKHRWVADVLSQRSLPFRVPTAFLTVDNPEAIQATLAPVFANSPLIRYRRDTLAEGLLHFPEYGDADTHRALDAFERILRETKHSADFFMPRDGLVVMNNHSGLHARTAFQDPDRHLLRIRLQWEDSSKHTAEYRLVTKIPSTAMPGAIA
jgi:alpha-ketoglutarate-dependent taurine dioxygenase